MSARQGLSSLALALSLCMTAPALAEQEPPAPAVTVTPVVMGDVTPSASFNGRVEAINTVSLKARVPGYLEQVLYQEGQTVEKGTLLFMIEKGQYEAQVAAVKGAIQRLEGTKELAEVEERRFKELLRRGVGSQDDADRASAQVKETNGDIASQQASLTQAELDLSYTEIKAPVTGRISRSAYDPGDFVGPLSGDLATIVSQDPIYVTFPVSQRALVTIKREAETPDQAVVKVKLADGSEFDQVGTINFIDVASNPSTDTTLVRAEFPNPDGWLVHQQLVNVVVEKKETEKQLLVPQRAIQIDQVGPYVLEVTSDNVVQITRIQTGESYGTNVTITDGLSEGANVIIEGLQKVRPGVKVAPTVTPANGG